MNMNKKLMSGFTLVELMIVVAIIGILASIAIPNYQKYQAKSRTTEAKLALSAAYTGQKSFIVEYNSYTSCLNAIGYAPDTGKRFYAVGFTTIHVGGAAYGTNAPTCTDGDGVTFFVSVPNTLQAAAGATAAARTDLPTTATSSTGFTVGAAAGISTVGKDKWQIDHDKNLIQQTIGY